MFPSNNNQTIDLQHKSTEWLLMATMAWNEVLEFFLLYQPLYFHMNFRDLLLMHSKNLNLQKTFNQSF